MSRIQKAAAREFRKLSKKNRNGSTSKSGFPGLLPVLFLIRRITPPGKKDGTTGTTDHSDNYEIT